MRIHGIGCSLVDNLYSPVDFTSVNYRSLEAGPKQLSGLISGGLVFGEAIEHAFGIEYSKIIKGLTGDLEPKRSIGGPMIVALIHITQMKAFYNIEVAYYGARSNDKVGTYLERTLSHFDLDIKNYIIKEGGTPFTDVLSDPNYNHGHGERTFINYIGVAGNYGRKELPNSFYDADILIYGGTALTPRIHDDLSYILQKGKDSGGLNFINTVYDFRNQKRAPKALWPIVEKKEDFRLIDLIITDQEEAARITGKKDKERAAQYFLAKGVKSGIITHGSKNIICFSNGSFFREVGTFPMPVSHEATRWMRSRILGSADTTGCGDNFVGGVYTSVAKQLIDFPNKAPSLKKAAILGIVSGGFAGCYLGGVYFEGYPGEKLEKIQPLLNAYTEQTGDRHE